jgi:hypothetical protein
MDYPLSYCGADMFLMRHAGKNGSHMVWAVFGGVQSVNRMLEDRLHHQNLHQKIILLSAEHGMLDMTGTYIIINASEPFDLYG